MSEDYIIQHCAPTLAGIKTGSIFTCPCESKEALLAAVRRINTRLGRKGLRVLPLRFSEKKALIYLYRPKKLSNDLADFTAMRLLQHHGYTMTSCEHCVVQLARRLRQGIPLMISSFAAGSSMYTLDFITQPAYAFFLLIVRFLITVLPSVFYPP